MTYFYAGLLVGMMLAAVPAAVIIHDNYKRRLELRRLLARANRDVSEAMKVAYYWRRKVKELEADSDGESWKTWRN